MHFVWGIVLLVAIGFTVWNVVRFFVEEARQINAYKKDPIGYKIKQRGWGKEPSYPNIGTPQEVRGLQDLADSLQHLFDMPPVKVVLVNAEGWGDIGARGGHGFVYIGDRCFRTMPEQMLHIMKHEMTHNYIQWHRLEKEPHGPKFHAKLESI